MGRIDWTAVTVALTAGIPATIAAVAAMRSHRGIRRTEKALDTGNERSQAEYVHEMAGTVEVIQAQTRNNSSEILDLKEVALDIRETVIQTREEVVDTRRKLERHLAKEEES